HEVLGVRKEGTDSSRTRTSTEDQPGQEDDYDHLPGSFSSAHQAYQAVAGQESLAPQVARDAVHLNTSRSLNGFDPCHWRSSIFCATNLALRSAWHHVRFSTLPHSRQQ